MMKCPVCHKNKAIRDPMLGVLPCQSCQDKPHEKARPQIEFTPNRIKEDRKTYFNDILQPHRMGQLSKEWLDVYGKELALKKGYSKSEIKHAKNVWKGTLTYYND